MTIDAIIRKIECDIAKNLEAAAALAAQEARRLQSYKKALKSLREAASAGSSTRPRPRFTTLLLWFAGSLCLFLA